MKRHVPLLLGLVGLLLAASPAPTSAAPSGSPDPAAPSGSPDPAAPSGSPASVAAGKPVASGRSSGGFVVRKGDQLVLDGKRFRFAGTNNYYHLRAE